MLPISFTIHPYFCVLLKTILMLNSSDTSTPSPLPSEPRVHRLSNIIPPPPNQKPLGIIVKQLPQPRLARVLLPLGSHQNTPCPLLASTGFCIASINAL